MPKQGVLAVILALGGVSLLLMTNKNKSRIIWTASAIGIVVALGLLAFFNREHLSIFTDTERAKEVIERAGPWGPLVFIAMQIGQVFFAPIPGQVTGFAGGYLFGTGLGTLYTIIGATIGFTLIFMLSRKLGRPFVGKFVNKKTMEKFDYIADSNGPFVLFLIFLLPVFPDDLICYLAGLTKIPIRTLILISLAGRLPGYLILSFTGNGTADGNIQMVAIIVGVLMILSAFAFWKRVQLEAFVKRISEKRSKQ
jgi:uncharacterized membrane protein YdjX (TVP38/TMEM64 family)